MAEQTGTTKDDKKKKKKKAAYGMNMAGDPTDMMEPHVSIRNVGRLFKLLAFVILILLIAEVGLGVAEDGIEALPLLLLEVAQLLVIAGLLWGGGDLTQLVVETNKDVRASRVLLWQISQLMQMQLGTAGVTVWAVDPEHPVEEDRDPEEEIKGTDGE